MKKSFITYFFFILIWEMTFLPIAISQTGFTEIIQIENSLALNIDDIQYSNNQLIICGNSFVDSAKIWGLFIAGLDTNGIVFWQNSIFDTSRQTHIVTNSPSQFLIRNNGTKIVPSYYFNTHNLVLFFTDSMGIEISHQQYAEVGLSIFPKSVLEISNYFYLFGKIQMETYLMDNYVIKTDSFGKIIWFKFYGTTSDNEDFGDVVDNKNGTLTISSTVYTKDYYETNPLQGYKKPWIFTVDTSGAIIKEWQGVWNDSRTLGGGPFCHTQNGDWIIVSADRKKFQVSQFISEFRYSPTITRLDSSFNLKWKINLTDFEGKYDRILDMEYDTIHDEFILAGNLNVLYPPEDIESEVWIVKVSGDGEILWNITDTVAYMRDEAHYTAGLTIAPSGSIYVAGFVDIYKDSTQEYGWIIKVTPDGCTETICTTTSIADQIRRIDSKINLFPNPLSDELNISIEGLVGKSEILLYDVYGRVTMRRDIYTGNNSIPIDMPGGVYYYSILNNSTLFTSGKLIIQ